MTMPMAASDSWEPMYFSFGVQVSLEALEPSGDGGSSTAGAPAASAGSTSSAPRRRASSPSAAGAPASLSRGRSACCG